MNGNPGKVGRYTLEFKEEAVRMAESSPTRAEAASSLRVVEQTLTNWVKDASCAELEGGQQEGVGDGGADLDQSFAGRAGEGNDGVRHSWEKARHTLQRPEVKYALSNAIGPLWPIRMQYWVGLFPSRSVSLSRDKGSRRRQLCVS